MGTRSLSDFSPSPLKNFTIKKLWNNGVRQRNFDDHKPR